MKSGVIKKCGMQMFEFLQRNIDNDRFEQLILAIKNNKCVAFTGAGLSKPLGYRVWEEGIIEGDNKTKTLIQLAGISKENAREKLLPDLIDECKKILGEKYYEYLISEFGRNNKKKFHQNLYFLWKSNYQHFITTNFDASLYDQREDCKNIRTYPSPDLKIMNERTLYYLHGRAFSLIDESEGTLKYYLENLVYGKSSYFEAYDNQNGEGAIELFIYSIIQKFSMLFIGFSMKDEDFKNTYKQMKEKGDRYLKKINRHPQREKELLNVQYILYPYPYKTIYMSDKDYEREIISFEYTEKQLTEINVSVVAYKQMGPLEHRGLSQALEYIMDAAPFKKKVELSELGTRAYDLNSAPTNEEIR